MLLQITKYLFKYLQNSFLAEDVIFMKNWDISTAEFKSSEFISSFYEQFPRDSELILYISYVCQLKLHDIESKFKLSGPEEIITIMKSLLYKALNNNINLTKIYKPLWEKSKLEHFFKQLELKNIHSTELIKTLLEIKQNPRSFLQNPDAFYHKMNYKHQYNTPPHNSPIHPKSPVNKLSKNYSENPNSNNSNIYDLNYINDEKNHRRTLSRSRSRSRSRLFRSMKLYGISENFKEEQQEYNSVFVIRDDYPPVESFINTEDFFISALNDNKNFEKFNLLNNSSINNGKGIRIKEQIDEDNKVLEEKKVQIINQYNNINHNIIQPKRKSNEKQQPSHKSVLLRINNEHKTEHSPSKKRSDSSSESKIKSSISESSSKSHRKRKKTPSNDSKSKNKRKISKKQQNNNNNNSSSNNNSNIYYSSFSKKKNPREDYEKYLTGGDSTKGIGGGHYERQLLKKYKGEKLAEFIEKASGSKISKEFGNYGNKKKNTIYYFD